MSRAWSCLLLPALLIACSPGPMDYIPTQERSLLRAQARLGDSGGQGGAISVSDMLQRARGTESGRLVLRFPGSIVQPDEAQRERLGRFAAETEARSIVVTARRTGFGDADALLGQRRAVAVARVLEERAKEVELRFVADLPADTVSISALPAGVTPASTSPVGSGSTR